MRPRLNPNTYTIVLKPFSETVKLLDDFFEIHSNLGHTKRRIDINSDEVYDLPRCSHYFVVDCRSNPNITILPSNVQDGNLVFIELFQKKYQVECIKLKITLPEDIWFCNQLSYYKSGKLQREIGVRQEESAWRHWVFGTKFAFEIDYESIRLKRNKLSIQTISTYLEYFNINFQRDIFDQIYGENADIFIYSKPW